MTQLKVKRPLWREAAIRLVRLPLVNPLCVAILRWFPSLSWRSRFPVRKSKTPVTVLGQAGAISMARPNACQVAMELFWGEGELADGADRHALETALRLSGTARVFLDVGSYTGLFALSAARLNPDLTAHAFEIIQENHDVLCENIALNALEDRVIPHLTGIADQQGSMRTPRSFEIGLLESSARLDLDYADGIDVPLETLDHLFADVQGPVVIKIDVEGFETEVLTGAASLLAGHHPDIICEVLTRAPRIPEMGALLRQHGYRFFHVTDKGLRLEPEIKPLKAWRDWLFTTKSDEALRALGVKLA